MSLNNLYHLLHFIPSTERWEMPPGLERAAGQLVRSGKLRINADAYRNFVRHGTSDDDLTFTARELSDMALLPETRARLQRLVPRAQGPDAVDELLLRLRNDLKKARGVEQRKELQVARVLAQSCHPAVFQLLLESGAEVFVSYSHNVGDLMGVHDWESHGLASGLQATNERKLQVYVSCGGDPFFEGDQKTYITDGFPALARMVVIGGQELGHFADLIRNDGRIVGRYSVQPTALAGRRADIAHLKQIRAHFGKRLAALKRAEDGLAFYDKRSKFSLHWLTWQVRRAIAFIPFRFMPRPKGLPLWFTTYPRLRAGTALQMFLDDMEFNLTPQADVYKRTNPREEEEIACIEATARVPQQVNKWGNAAVAAAWPNLHRLYCGQVILGCWSAISNPPPDRSIIQLQYITMFFRRLMRTRPGHYPE